MENSIIFPNLHITLQNVGKTFNVFGFPIAFYGLIIGIGMLLGIEVVLKEAKRLGRSEDSWVDICMITVLFSVIGARLYYVIFSWDYYKDNLSHIFKFREGGLAIYGGVLAGILTLFIISKIKKYDFLEMTDIAIIGVIIGQICGRWGNFFNREVFGQYTDGLFAMLLPVDSVRDSSDITQEMLDNLVTIDGVNFVSVHPTFLYESLWNLALLIFILATRKKKKFNGQVFFTYLVVYGIGRFWIEGVRTDQLKLWNTGLPVSQVVAVVMIIVGIVFSVYNYKKHPLSTTN